ncbi:hypothetical protein SALBM311S_09336 [Streptomyces alboniger]
MPDGVLKPAGGLDQQLVPGLVSDRVVDGLEAVQVDEEHGRAAQRGAPVRGAAAGQCLLDAPGEQGAVGQVGQRVVLGVVLELRLQSDSLGHVPAVEDEAAVVTVDCGLDVEPTALAGPEAAFDARGGFLQGAGGEEAAHLVHHAAQILRVDESGQLRADELLGGAPVHSGGGRGDVTQDAVGRGDHDDVAGALHQGTEVVLLLRQFLGEGDVVEQHDALAHDESEHHRAAGEQHHAVDAAAVEDVVEDSQGADGGGEVGREGGQGAGDGPGGRVPAGIVSLHGRMVVRARALSGQVLAHHAGAPGRGWTVGVGSGPRCGCGPGGVREQQRAGEPARVEQLSGAVRVVQQWRGEQGVAHHGQGERPDRGVDRRPVHRRAPEVQGEHHADQGDVQKRVGERERGVRNARPLGPGRLREGETPGEREQGAADQPGVQAETDPTRLRHRPLGEHQQAHDGGRREAQEEQVGVAGAGHLDTEDDLVPPPYQVAQGRHRRGEGEQHPRGSKADPAAAGVEEAGDGPGARRGTEPEVTHDQGGFARAPAERGTEGVARAHQGQHELADQARSAARSRWAGGRRAGYAPDPRRRVEGGRGRRGRTDRALPVRAVLRPLGSRCAGCACLLRLL